MEEARLRKAVQNYCAASGDEATNARRLRRALQDEFKIDLSAQKDVIRSELEAIQQGRPTHFHADVLASFEKGTQKEVDSNTHAASDPPSGTNLPPEGDGNGGARSPDQVLPAQDAEINTSASAATSSPSLASNGEAMKVAIGDEKIRAGIVEYVAGLGDGAINVRSVRRFLEQRFNTNLALKKNLIKAELEKLAQNPAELRQDEQKRGQQQHLVLEIDASNAGPSPTTNSKYVMSQDADTEVKEQRKHRIAPLKRGNTLMQLARGIGSAWDDKVATTYQSSHSWAHMDRESWCRHICTCRCLASCCSLRFGNYEMCQLIEAAQFLGIAKCTWESVPSQSWARWWYVTGSAAALDLGAIDLLNLTQPLEAAIIISVFLLLLGVLFLYTGCLCRAQIRKRRELQHTRVLRTAMQREMAVRHAATPDAARIAARNMKKLSAARAIETRRRERILKRERQRHQQHLQGKSTARILGTAEEKALTKEAIHWGSCGGCCVRRIVPLATNILVIPTALLCARLYECGNSRESLRGCTSSSLPPLLYSLGSLCLFAAPLLFMSLTIPLAVAHYCPRVGIHDPLFAKGAPLADQQYLSYEDQLHYEAFQRVCTLRGLYSKFPRRCRFARFPTLAFKIFVSFLCVMASREVVRILIPASFGGATMLLAVSGGIHIRTFHDQIMLVSLTSATLVSASGSFLETPVHAYLEGVGVSIFYAEVLVFLLLILRLDRHWTRYCSRNLRFENTATGDSGSAVEVINRWNLEMELKIRVWQPFWDNMLHQHYSQAVQQRLHHFQRLWTEHGKARMEREHRESKELAAEREYVMQHLEGPDAYFIPKAITRGELDSLTRTGFGFLRVQHFPFSWSITYDDTGCMRSFDDAESLRRLVKLNQSRVVQLRREHRITLRAMALNGIEVEFPHREARFETVLKDKLVEVELQFSRGTVVVQSMTGAQLSHGFHCFMEFKDGTGVWRERSGIEHRFTNMQTRITLEDMGLTENFEMAAEAEHDSDVCILTRGEVVGQQLRFLEAAVRKQHQDYRKTRIAIREAEAQVLPETFLFDVYNAPLRSEADVKAYFASIAAQSPELAQLPEKHKDGMEFLYHKMEHLQRHPSSAFWYVFFNDVWEHNRRLLALRSLRARIDPARPDSLCYRVVKQAELEKVLDEAGVLQGPQRRCHYRHFCCGGHIFTSKLVSLLYELTYRYREWRQMQTAGVDLDSTSSEVLRSLSLHSDEDRQILDRLQPLLQRRRRFFSKLGERVPKRIRGLAKLKGLWLPMTMTVAWSIALGSGCITSQEICTGKLTRESAWLMVVAVPVMAVAAIFALGAIMRMYTRRKMEKQHAAARNRMKPTSQREDTSVRSKIRDKEAHLFSDDPFEESNTEQLLADVETYIRKGRWHETEASTKTAEGKETQPGDVDVAESLLHAWDFYRAARLRLQAIGLPNLHQKLCGVLDREASCIASIGDASSLGRAASTFQLLAETWKSVLSDGSGEQPLNSDRAAEVHHHVAECIQKSFLCALSDSSPASIYAFRQFEKKLCESGHFESMEQHKRYTAILRAFFALDHRILKQAIDEWNQSGWTEKMHRRVMLRLQELRGQFLQSTISDAESRADGCSRQVRLLVVGDAMVGKTSLIVRWLYNVYVDEPASVTKGKQDFKKIVEFSEAERYSVRVREINSIDDLRQEQRDAHIIILACDCTSTESFQRLSAWVAETEVMFGQATLVSLKTDAQEKVVRRGTLRDLADANGIPWYECSSRDGKGVKEMFECVVRASQDRILQLGELTGTRSS